jgi:hypothetical protein
MQKQKKIPRKNKDMEKKRSGPKPRLYSLHPLEFEEALDILLKAKPKKKVSKDAQVDAEEGKKTAEK